MRTPKLSIITAMLVVFALSVVEPAIAHGPSPRVRIEIMGSAPGPDYYWVNGYWWWDDERWVWVPGYWSGPGFFYGHPGWHRGWYHHDRYWGPYRRPWAERMHHGGWGDHGRHGGGEAPRHWHGRGR